MRHGFDHLMEERRHVRAVIAHDLASASEKSNREADGMHSAEETAFSYGAASEAANAIAVFATRSVIVSQRFECVSCYWITYAKCNSCEATLARWV